MRQPPIIPFVNGAHLLDHLFMLIFPTAVIGIGNSMGMSYGELLYLSIGGFIAFGAGSLPAGWLGDHWSRRHMMAVFFFGIGAAGLATSLATSPLWLAVGLTAIGLFAAIYHPVGGALLAAHATQLGRTLGVNGVFGNLGVAGAALITGLLTQNFGWRVAFVAPSIVAVVGGIAFLVMVPNESAKPKSKAASGKRPDRAVLIRAFAALAVATLAGGVTFNGATVALPKLIDERTVGLFATPAGVGVLASLVYLVGALAQLTIGRFIDRVPIKLVFLPLAALQAPFLYLAGQGQGWAVILSGALVMLAMFGQVTVNDAMVARYTDDNLRARAYALRYFGTFSASALSVPLVGWFYDRFGGFQASFAVLAGFGAIIFLAALAFPYRPEEVAPTTALTNAESRPA